MMDVTAATYLYLVNYLNATFEPISFSHRGTNTVIILTKSFYTLRTLG